MNAAAALAQRSARKTSPNVVGVLRGTNADEAVAITAHWDHFGTRAVAPGDTPDTDRINNGAYDNASGCAAVLTMAQALSRAGRAPGRSIYVVFTTAEESGLLGSEYFAQHPPQPMARFAANINVDGANYLGRTKDIVMLGSDRSSLGPMLAALAAERGRVVGQDTHPERGYFFRSDHFPLAKAGVPALSLSEPKQFEGPTAAALLARQEAYNGKDYHQPSDEFDSAWDFSGAAEDMSCSPQLAWQVAAAPHDAGLQRRRSVRAGPERDDAALVSLDDIRAAAERVRGTALRTPVLPLPWPGPAPAHPFWVKCENLQPMGAFKIRGAFNMLAQMPAAARARGVITYSSGNHGQGVAMAAQAMGVPAVIVMPTTAPGVKVEGVKRYGAEVIFEGTTSLDRQRRAEAEAAARGLTMVPPFDHPMVIAGQGTLGLEILEQVPDVGTVYVPMGGGGMIAGRRHRGQDVTARGAGRRRRAGGRRQDAGRARRRGAGDARADRQHRRRHHEHAGRRDHLRARAALRRRSRGRARRGHRGRGGLAVPQRPRWWWSRAGQRRPRRSPSAWASRRAWSWPW